MVTIKDVAKRAGVALSTASYALNNSTKVSKTTKEKVERAARELNYKKNGLAADLKKTKTNTIALILSDLSGPYYSELIRGVQDVAIKNGYDLIACSTIGGSESTAIKFLKEKRADGVIIQAHNIDDNVILQAARKGFPLIVLDRKLNHKFIVNVEVDNIEGGYKITQHLIDKGNKKIAYISGPWNSLDNKLRFEGYLKALEDNNLTYNDKWNITGNFTRKGGYEATKNLISQGDLPEAVFFGNDEMAIGGLEAFKENDIHLPEDISIVGFDDIELAEYVSPSLTTIKQPKYELGALSVDLILKVLSGKGVDPHYTLYAELIERSSVKTINNREF